jgi:TIR domain-containing protein/pentapeptide repeat protein
LFTVKRAMANDEHLQILKRDTIEWTLWRRDHPKIVPDLRGADLRGIRLSRVYLGYANLDDANLGGADLSGANLRYARLNRANLRNAYLRYADFNGAHIEGANLSGADLYSADLSGANVNSAIAVGTIFANIDLRKVKGLESIKHVGPSEISISTIYRSEGKIPETFLLGCGVPDAFIIQIPDLIAGVKPIQFYSCFISYSGKDEEFARHLHSRVREAGLRVWFAPEDIKGGEKLYDQIERAIHVHDRLLLVLSESSLRSKWVELEIRRARNVELKVNRRKLFPIRLVSYEALQEWMCLNSTTGEDLAEEVRSYFIPDFSNWKDHDAFEAAFDRLLRDLKAEEKPADSFR